MKNKLFWRLFWAFLATLLLTVMVMSFLMVAMVRSERQSALEAEVLVQARDVARILKQMDYIGFGFRNRGGLDTILTTLDWKLQEIYSVHDAEIWVVRRVTGNGATALVLDQDGPFYEINITDPEVLAQVEYVFDMHEIRVQGLIKELGPNIVTVGVPCTDIDDIPNNAVLLHISMDSLQVDYRDIVRYALIAAGASMVIGVAVAYWISRRQTMPLGKINRAVTQFAKGKLDARVELKGDDEVAELGRSFNKMAEDLSRLEESRRSFVANVSHELRSPLTCIGGYVQGMIDGTISEHDHGKYLNVVQSETLRLGKMVNELLDLSKLESGNFSLSQTRFDVDELLAQELIKFEQRIDEKHLDVDVIFRQQPCYVMADSDRIRQVVTNLIDNAVKFTPDGGSLVLTTHVVDQKCYVSVQDSGPGISQEDLPFIFDRFYKADKAHTSGMGTGLGLSIAKRIMDQHGQTLKVTSGTSGTVFSFTLAMATETSEKTKE